MRGAYARELRRVRAGKRVYVDETGATTGMTRLRGRAPPGERVVEAVPQGCWRMTTLVGALRRDGPTAALAFDGATDGVAFESFVRQTLCPTLRKDDLVVMDRLGAHRGPAVRELIEAAGARLLYLPPYSPDLEPDRGNVVEGEAAVAVGSTTKRQRPDRRHGRRVARRHRQRRPRLLWPCWMQVMCTFNCNPL